ncbi:MAG: protein-methionine-sulfoxide reductase heme-binding subunit MsrQ [Cypionkella sp.]|uniref:sulfite oxidase heme-binding subunit YedZ n=1 Tax=Cypionkella sp. TaxID=2811411 RepID=UPI002ABAE95D|nr:protein-methionine-sulfoxide reductase heme-binding subunit MsrQ [Cypionkella sp.]MDZ4311747.1 protein-methionine-sulfoxide reductase heme-binding subunit MsrQ [Cypionkella sp.]
MLDAINQTARRIPAYTIYIAGIALAAWVIYAALATPDPAKVLERDLGTKGLQILIATLCITPLRWYGVNLLKFRRALGLTGFMFIALHLMTWVVLDLALRWSEILTELTKRPFIIVGMLAFVALIPLAVTSNNTMVKRLGALRWKRLHWLAYPATLAGAVHFVMIGKVYTLESALYFAAVAGLLLARRLKARKKALQTA